MAQVHQNVNLMNENVHRQNELKAKQVVLLLLLLFYTWHATWCLYARMPGRERRQCRPRCHLLRTLLLWRVLLCSPLAVVVAVGDRDGAGRGWADGAQAGRAREEGHQDLIRT